MTKLVFENVRLSGLTRRFGEKRKGNVVVRLRNDDAELSIQGTEDDSPGVTDAAVYRLTLEQVG